MNEAAVLALIGNLYAQLVAAQSEAEALRAQLAEAMRMPGGDKEDSA